MQVSVEKSSALQRKLTVQVPGDGLQKKIDARLRELGKQVKIKGFRPGRVPFKVLQQRYGKSVQQEIVAQEVQSSLAQALQQESLRPASSPVLESEPSLQSGGDLEFTASIEVFPEVAAIDTASIEIKKPTTQVTESDVGNMLDTLRAQRQTWTDLDQPGTAGQQVTVEYAADTDAGRVPESGKQRISVVMGQSGFDDLEKAVAKLGPGEETTAKLKFPDDYQDAKLAGHKVKTELGVIKVQQAMLPEVDAEFIKSFGIASGELDELNSEIRSNLERELKQATMSYLKVQLVDKLLKMHPDMEVPEGMVRDEAANLQRQAASRMGIEAEKQDLEPFIGVARNRVKSGLLLSEIARQNSIMVDGARVRQAIETVADTYEQPQEVVRLYYSEQRLLSAVENSVLEEQVVDWVLEQAKVTEESMNFNDVINAAARRGQAG